MIKGKPNEDSDNEAYMVWLFNLIYKKKPKLLKEECTLRHVETYALLQESCTYLHLPGVYDCFEIIYNIAKESTDYSETASDALLSLCNNNNWFLYIRKNDLALNWGLKCIDMLLDLGADPFIFLDFSFEIIIDKCLDHVLSFVQKKKLFLIYPFKYSYIRMSNYVSLTDAQKETLNEEGFTFADKHINYFIEKEKLSECKCTTKSMASIYLIGYLNKNKKFGKLINTYYKTLFYVWDKVEYMHMIKQSFNLDKKINYVNAEDIPEYLLDSITKEYKELTTEEFYVYYNMLLIEYDKDKSELFSFITTKNMISKDILEYVVYKYF